MTTKTSIVFSKAEVEQRIQGLPQWRLQNDVLVTDLVFTNFVAAFSFLSVVAMVSEKMDHHAEIFNVYNRVTLSISTHDANGITEKDIAWITAVSKFFPPKA